MSDEEDNRIEAYDNDYIEDDNIWDCILALEGAITMTDKNDKDILTKKEKQIIKKISKRIENKYKTKRGE